MPRFSHRALAAACVLAFSTVWLVAHILRPTLAGRKLRQFSPLYNNFPADAFDFTSPRPAWLAPTPPGTPPLVLRIAVISHPSEVARRAAIRDSIFADVPAADVAFEYKFFVAKAPGQRQHPWSMTTLDEVVDEEQRTHGDMYVLDAHEGLLVLGVKRHAALLWVCPVVPRIYALQLMPCTGRGSVAHCVRHVHDVRLGFVHPSRGARSPSATHERHPARTPQD
jgi:hypothetical protein